QRRAEKRAKITFKTAALEVHKKRSESFRNPKHKAQWISTLEEYAFPSLGSRPVDSLTTGDVLSLLFPIWNVIPETARRVKQRMSVVFDWAKIQVPSLHSNPVDGVT